MDLINKVIQDAEKAGITDHGAFNLHYNNLKRHVRGGKIDPAMEEVNAIITLIKNAGPSRESGISIEELFESLNAITSKIPELPEDFGHEDLNAIEASFDEMLKLFE